MANMHMKTCSVSYVITEMLIETKMWYYYTPIRMATIPKTGNPNYSMRV